MVRVMDQVVSYPNSYLVFSGRVEVCYNGTYRAVCSGGLSQDNAMFVCSRLQGNPYYSELF